MILEPKELVDLRDNAPLVEERKFLAHGEFSRELTDVLILYLSNEMYYYFAGTLQHKEADDNFYFEHITPDLEKLLNLNYRVFKYLNPFCMFNKPSYCSDCYGSFSASSYKKDCPIGLKNFWNEILSNKYVLEVIYIRPLDYGKTLEELDFYFDGANFKDHPIGSRYRIDDSEAQKNPKYEFLNLLVTEVVNSQYVITTKRNPMHTW